MIYVLANVSSLLKKLFEGQASKEPSELLVKAAAEGKVEEIEELCLAHGTDVRRVYLNKVKILI